MADGVKQAVIIEEASKRYLAALAFNGLNTGDRPRRNPKNLAMALMNTESRGRGPEGRGDCAGHGPGSHDRGGHKGRGGDKEQDNDSDEQGGEPFSDMNNDGEKGCWNCDSKDHWNYQ